MRRHAPTGSVIHLCFHGVGEASRPTCGEELPYWVSVDFFHGVLDLVADRDDVRLSFDDGFRSDVDVVLPALQQRGLTATFFPVLGRLEDPEFLDRDGVLALSEAGMHLGVHGMTHTVWRECDDRALVHELDESRRRLHDITGRSVTSAACPLGSYDRRVLRVLREQGFRAVFTSDRARARADAWLQPRYSLHVDDTLADVETILDDTRSFGEVGYNSIRMWAKRRR